jgi:hypothetical protein
MKKSLLFAALILLGLAMTLPTAGYARGGRGGGHSGGRHYSGGYHHYSGGYGYYGGYRYGFRGPRVYVGPGFIGPWYGPWYGSWYGYGPIPSYYEVPPADYIDPGPEPAYAYPDPDFVERYGNRDAAEKPGEWVTVPGQYVNGQWINEHKVWVAGGASEQPPRIPPPPNVPQK